MDNPGAKHAHHASKPSYKHPQWEAKARPLCRVALSHHAPLFYKQSYTWPGPKTRARAIKFLTATDQLTKTK